MIKTGSPFIAYLTTSAAAGKGGFVTQEEIKDIGRLVSNDVYKAVIVHIQQHERRGWNAHHRAQACCEFSRINVTDWLTAQEPMPPPEAV